MTYRALVLIVAVPTVLRAQDTTAAKASLLAADRAAFAGEAAFVATLDARAALLLPGVDILAGRAAIARRVEGRVGPADLLPGARALHAVVSRDGTFGCTTGVLHRVPADSTQSSTGRYAACWRKDAGGAWRLLALSRADAPPAVKSLPDSLPDAPGSSGAAAARGVDAARAMADADRAFGRYSADSGGPGGAFARWIASDGMMLGGRPVPVRGSAQARAAFANFPASGHFAWAPVDSLTRASRDGSLGFTIGEAVIAPSPGATSYSKYLTIWRREADGSCRFVFDIGSDRPAPVSR